MTAMRCDVAVAGEGIVGLAAAIGLKLASRGALEVMTIAPGAAPADPRALALVAGSRRQFEALGAWAAIEPDAEPMRAIAIADGKLADVARPFLLGFDEETLPGEVFAHVAPADSILSALAARAAAVGVTSRRGRVVGRTMSAAATTLTLDDGSEISATLAVAADGRNSALRKLAGIRSRAWGYGQDALVVTVAHSRPHDGRAVQHFLPGGPFALLPMRENRSGVVWSEREEIARHIAVASDDEFLAELSQRAGGDLGRLTLAGPRKSFPLAGMIAESFVGERLALVGDAARVLHPIAGQGVNLGLRDAAALVETAVEAARLGLDFGRAEILERYQRWRRFESVAFLAATDGLVRLFRIDDAGVRAIRDLGLGLVERAPGAKRRFVEAAAGFSGEPPRLVMGEVP